jgi:hypothetical protein
LIRSVEWAAGLFEGEGCFTIKRGRYPAALLSMTDEDVIRDFHETVGFGRMYGPFPYKNPKWKPCWKWTTTNAAEFEPFAELMAPHMGARRSARLAEVRQAAAERPTLPTKRPRDERGCFLPKEMYPQ